MSKRHIRWIAEVLENGPLTTSQIIDKMSWRKSCPTTNEVSNYLGKSPLFQKSTKEVRQKYMTGGASYVAVWKLRK